MPSAAREQVKGVLISLWLAFFLPREYWVGKESHGKEGEKKGRGRAWQGGEPDPRSPRTPGFEGRSRESLLPPVGAAHQPERRRAGHQVLSSRC